MSFPNELATYIKAKSSNGGRGRNHIIIKLQQKFNVENEVLEILERAWIKGHSFMKIAKHYTRRGLNVDASTIFRLIKDLEPHKEEISKFLLATPRQKIWYNEDLDFSDFETVNNYIKYSVKFKIKTYKTVVKTAYRMYVALGRKDPKSWNNEEALKFIYTLPKAMQSNMVDAVRRVAPQFADKNDPQYIPTKPFRKQVGRRFIEIFGEEMQLIRTALKDLELHYERIIFELHVTTGAREGSGKNKESGICGIRFSRFKKGFSKMDLYESKGEFWSRNCPIDMLFPHLPQEIRQIWIERERPTEEKIILEGYKELTKIYDTIRKQLIAYYEGKVDPYLIEQFKKLRPHYADKIHCNLLWEAGIPVEVVAGKFLGGEEALGLMGRVWKSTDTITKYYLMLSERSPRMKAYMQQVKDYSKQFNGAK